MSVERLQVQILDETEKSYKVRVYGKEVYLPKSQIEKMTRRGDTAEIVIPYWLFKANFGD